MTKVVLFARDSGAANHVVAVTEVLASRLPGEPLLRLMTKLAGAVPNDLVTWGQGPALAVFAAAGLSASSAELTDAKSAVQRLAETKAHILITGTGDVDDVETRLLWGAARASSIPSMAMLDSPDNLEFRFNVAAGQRPDFVVAPDPVSAAKLRECGFANHDVVAIDNLHHARLRRLAPEGRERVRNAWGVGPDVRIVLFVSENAAEVMKMGRSVDFNEFALLEQLIGDVAARRAVGRLMPEGGEIAIVVRPHPRDMPGKYDGYRRQSGPRVIVSAAGSPVEALVAADLVAGMRSAMLNEAQIFGRPVHRLLDTARG